MKYLILFIAAPILLAACKQEDVNISDTGRKIVINGLVGTDSLMRVSISESAFIAKDSSENEVIKNAKGYIYQNNKCVDSLIYGVLNYNTLPSLSEVTLNYSSRSLILLPGNTYTIVVKVPGLPDATAQTEVPNLVKIEKVDTSRTIIEGVNYGPSNVSLIANIEFTDPANETNYYFFCIDYDCITEEEGRKTHSITNGIFGCNDPIVEYKIDLDCGIQGIIFSDKLINGVKHNLTVTMDENNIGMPFTNNRVTETINGVSKYIDHGKILYFMLYSIPEAYFKYIQTIMLYKTNSSNPLYEPVQVYSNVTGGYGIFAGAAVSADTSIAFHY